MAVMNSVLPSVSPQRRRRVRHKIQTPAYVTFASEPGVASLDLHEVVDISEDGVSIQCHSPLKVESQVNLCLELADCAEHIYTTGKVVWADSDSGRMGFRFAELSPESLKKLRQWLFVNVMAGVAHGEANLAASSQPLAPRPNYSDTLAAVAAVQGQVEAMGADLAGALRLIADRAQTLVRASGAAIALADGDPDFLVCRASAGSNAPPVGARLQVGSGFSGDCVKSGTVQRCDDTETDARVDPETCRRLDIRSMLAVPLRAGEKCIGLIEVFSGQANTFTHADGQVLQRLAESVLGAVNRATRAEDLPAIGATPDPPKFEAPQGSVLFAAAPEPEQKPEAAQEKISGINLPRSHLILLVCAAAAIALVLGYNLAPLIQSRLDHRGRAQIQTVLASSQPSEGVQASEDLLAVESATPERVRQMAEDGNPVAENALGLRYFIGDEKRGLQRDETQAFYWLHRAAEHGNPSAQAKLGFLYWGGRGVAKDLNQAYFWTVLARSRGDQETRDLAAVLSATMSRSQAAAIERQADVWLQQHVNKKPTAAH